MASAPPTNDIEMSILRRIIRPEGKDLSQAAARSLLRLAFDQDDHDRMHELAAKSQAGDLTASEQSVLDAYVHIGLFLDVLHAKARQVLNEAAPRRGRRHG
jgi:hypothetical protein